MVKYRDSSVHTSVGCVTDNGTWRWAMSATDQLQAPRGERARIEGIEEKEEAGQVQSQKRTVGNERRWDRRGARIRLVMRLEKGGAPRVVSTSTGSRVCAVLASNRDTGDVFRRCQSHARSGYSSEKRLCLQSRTSFDLYKLPRAVCFTGLPPHIRERWL